MFGNEEAKDLLRLYSVVKAISHFDIYFSKVRIQLC